jgi:hypothetical protein
MRLALRFPSKEPLLLGVYAWVLTIASPTLEEGVSSAVRLLAAAALVLLISGWLILEKYPRIADGLAVLGFSVLNFGALTLLGPGRLGIRAPVAQLTMGAVVWCFFAISWARARNLARHLAVLSGNTLDVTPTPADPLSSQLAIGFLGLCSAGVIGLLGRPSADGHGALTVGLIIVATLRLSTTAGLLVSRIERATSHWRVPASRSGD